MKKIFYTIRNSTYILHIMTLMSGTIIAQIVMFAFMPILTRLYTPSEFGTYSLFFSVVAVMGVVSSWKYDKAIMLPKSNRDAQALVFLSIIILLGMTLLISVVLFLFNDFFIHYFEGLSQIVRLIPIAVLLIGSVQIANAYTSRHQFYKKLATTRVVTSSTTAVVQSLSKFIFNLDGLIFGKMFADAVALFLLVRYHMKKQTLQLHSLSRRRLKINAKKYENFPKYESFSAFLNEASQVTPIFLLTYLYSIEVAGLYALTTRVLRVPTSLVGGAARQVYYQRASRMYAAGENIFNIYKKTTLALLKIFIIPFFVFLSFGEILFSFIFGDEWSMSGVFAQIMIISSLFNFINSPSMINFSILNLQKLAFIIQLFSIFLKILGILIGYWNNSVYMSIILFSLASIATNIVITSMIYKKLK